MSQRLCLQTWYIACHAISMLIAQPHPAPPCVLFQSLPFQIPTTHNWYCTRCLPNHAQITQPIFYLNVPQGSGRLRSTSTISLNSLAYTKTVFHQQKEDQKSLKQAHRYILFNCDDVQQYIREHEDIVNNHTGKRKWSKAKSHSNDFTAWFETRAMNDDISYFVKGLSRGPNTVAKKFSGYVINGYRFHTRMRDGRCKTQNSGVTVEAITRSFASSKDERPRKDSLTYYGAITDIIELNYYELCKYVLFKCDWFEVKEDNYGMKFVHFDKKCYQEDPFVLATQVHQCFYVKGHLEENRYYVMKRVPRDLFNMGDQSDGGQEFHWGEPSDSSSNPTLLVDDAEVDLVRTDVPATIIDQPLPTLDDQPHEIDYE
ncbi:uncharacterized protein G2W53_017915 [Senna tora]|uniref:DUF4216 domain-containing protein n=1 Tax=Senna tora TaxID=362788 RepID=A0A834TTP6_9FABA|nr:uncharacterized protein G2W53_017915 [Senna tora]